MKKLGNKLILAYTAGIVDGEGSISLSKRTSREYKSGYQLRLAVCVANTNEWLVQWFKMQFGGYVNCTREKRENRKDRWQWMIVDGKAAEFLKSILPYLQIKRPQAELAIKFQDEKHYGHINEKEAAIKEAQRILMRTYNKKGKLNAT